MRGAYFLFDFGVLGYVVIKQKNAATKQVKSFYESIKIYQ